MDREGLCPSHHVSPSGTLNEQTAEQVQAGWPEEPWPGADRRCSAELSNGKKRCRLEHPPCRPCLWNPGEMPSHAQPLFPALLAILTPSQYHSNFAFANCKQMRKIVGIFSYGVFIFLKKKKNLFIDFKGRVTDAQSSSIR